MPWNKFCLINGEFIVVYTWLKDCKLNFGCFKTTQFYMLQFWQLWPPQFPIVCYCFGSKCGNFVSQSLSIVYPTLALVSERENTEGDDKISELYLALLKGQLISEQIFGVQKCNEIIARISALASKMGQIKKVKAHYHPN